MSNLYLVESPFQLISAIEARETFGKGTILIRYSGLKNNDLQLKKIIEFYNLSNIWELKINVNKTILDYLKIAFFKIKPFNYNKLFLGNLESGFLNIITKKFKQKDIILLDDGAKSIYLQASFDSSNFYNFFTMFNLKSLPNQKIEINNFKYLKSKIHNNNLSDDIIFIGAKLSEIGLIKEDYYLDILSKLLKKYKNIIYIPHREESFDKLAKIEKMGIKIKYLNLPIELIGTQTIPKKVISFYSTALISLKKIYNIESSFIKLNINRDILKIVYNYYEKELIEEKIW